MDELLAFLQSVRGYHVTVHEIYQQLKREGSAIGMTTVYRHLDRLVQKGEVAKYTIEGTNAACFEYIGDRKIVESSSYYHFKCEECGQLLHVQCAEVSRLCRHMLDHHEFEMDTTRTVFIGRCAECRTKGH